MDGRTDELTAGIRRRTVVPRDTQPTRVSALHRSIPRRHRRVSFISTSLSILSRSHRHDSSTDASFLWTACAYTSHAYADESAKAWFIQFQLIAQSTGSAIACAIALGVNYPKTTSGGVSSPVYGAFIAIHLLAGILAVLFIVDPKTVQRDDGTYLSVFPRPTPRAEWEGMKDALTQPRVMFFIIAGFSFDLWVAPLGSFNAHTFALRARGLNGLCFFGCSMIGGLIFLWLGSEGGAGRWLKSKKDRAYAMLGYVLGVNAMGFGAWMGYLTWAGMGDRSIPGPGLDWTMGNEWARGFVVSARLHILPIPLQHHRAKHMTQRDPQTRQFLVSHIADKRYIS